MSRLLFTSFDSTAPTTWAVQTSRVSYWGPHFPDVLGGHYWGPHFPDGLQAAQNVDPFGPGGVATFALDLEAGFKLSLVWKTDIIPHADGSEQRTAQWDRPKQRYSGTAM